MKTLLLLFSVFTFTCSFATIKTTVADGDWFNANNWDPVGVPLNEDTLIVNHVITAIDSVGFNANWLIIENNGEIISDTTFTLNGNFKGYGDLTAQYFFVEGDSTLIYGSMHGDHFTTGSSFNINHGSILSDTLTIIDNFENQGLIDVELFNTGGGNFINRSNAAINATSLAVFAATNSNNEFNATIMTGDLVTGSDFTNNGDVSCTNWTHGSGTVTGTTGRFCIAMCFSNNSTISGTVDICDATPNNACDIDMGSIDGTVTNCTSAPCENNVGVEEEVKALTMVFPNPANDFIQIEGVSKGYELVIYNMTGQPVKYKLIENNIEFVDVSKLKAGTYIVSVSYEDRTEMHKLIIR